RKPLTRVTLADRITPSLSFDTRAEKRSLNATAGLYARIRTCVIGGRNQTLLADERSYRQSTADDGQERVDSLDGEAQEILQRVGRCGLYFGNAIKMFHETHLRVYGVRVGASEGGINHKASSFVNSLLESSS